MATNRTIGPQALRYVLVGLSATILNYILFIGLIAAGLHFLLAATTCSATTLIFSYFANRRFTFAANKPADIREFSSFLLVFAVQYVLAMAGYALLMGYFGFGPTWAFILNNLVVASVTFTLLRHRTFRQSARQDG